MSSQRERQRLRTATLREQNVSRKAPFLGLAEVKSWSFWRAGIVELLATFLYLYISLLTIMVVKKQPPVTTSSAHLNASRPLLGLLVAPSLLLFIACNNIRWMDVEMGMHGNQRKNGLSMAPLSPPSTQDMVGTSAYIVSTLLHLLKTMPCSSIYYMKLPYVVTANLGAFSRV